VAAGLRLRFPSPSSQRAPDLQPGLRRARQGHTARAGAPAPKSPSSHRALPTATGLLVRPTRVYAALGMITRTTPIGRATRAWGVDVCRVLAALAIFTYHFVGDYRLETSRNWLSAGLDGRLIGILGS